MKRIGITGNIGSGKSAVSSILRTRGFTVLDADEVALRVSSDPLTLLEVSEALGPQYVTERGLNRPLLAELVFKNALALETLNGIIHPKVRAQMSQLEGEATGATVFQDIPLLFENGLEHGFNATILVDAPIKTRLERVRKRSGLTAEQFWARENAQMSPQQKRARADWIVKNTGTLEQLEREVLRVLEGLDLGG